MKRENSVITNQRMMMISHFLEKKETMKKEIVLNEYRKISLI